MILRALHVQGWKCFADPVEVGPFAESLNVLHAPNATGKSTLFEAMLRGLLDGHRVTGREVEALRPWGRALAPTVTVVFSHGGVEYRLTKRFLDRPSSDLARQEGGRFVRLAEGDAADERAREILTRNPPGRGLARPENWGLAQVLWAPQGNLALASLSGDVIANIRASLGAQVSGTGSGPMEERIEEAYSGFFTPGGKLRTGKDAPAVVRVREALEIAVGAHRDAVAKYQAFEEASRRVEDLRARRAQARRDAEALAQTLSETRARAETYRSLKAEAENRTERAKGEEARYNALKQQIELIATTEKELGSRRSSVERLAVDAPLHAREVEERQKTESDARKTLEDGRKGRDAVEAAGEQAKQADRYVHAKKDLERLDDRVRRVTEAEAGLKKRREERAALVAPDEKTLRAVRKALKDRDEGQVRLDAALISVEVVPERDAVLDVVAGEQMGIRQLKRGVPIEEKGSPEVVVDIRGIARIRARGPSGPIADLRAARDQASLRLAKLTEGFGTSEIDVLESLNTRARTLEDRVAEASTQLTTLLGKDTLETLQEERAKCAALLEEIVHHYPRWRVAVPDAMALAAEAKETRDAFIAQVEHAEGAWQKSQVALSAAKEHSAHIGTQLREAERLVKNLCERLVELTSDGKQAAERDAELRTIALAWDAAKASLEEATKKLAGFTVDPSEDVARLEKQLLGVNDSAIKALEAEKSAEGGIEAMVARGPYSTMVLADEDVAKLQRELAAEELRVAAVKLLRDTVAECRAAALAAVAAPVEMAATHILQRVAGSRLGRVQLGDTFEPGHVIPELAEGSVSVEQVSGGEREQIYLATRLALADVLAKGERQLVVLDDVLTATDTGRLARVMGVLEEAAQRLQVLILTCHPERYRGLAGANFVDLEAIIRGV
jgi:DNA repair exonuclease SbcCD ATPase subunit